MRSCRNCNHAYLRTEQTVSWNYEACALSIAPMQPYLNDLCDLWTLIDEDKAKEFLHDKPTILWGETLEL